MEGARNVVAKLKRNAVRIGGVNGVRALSRALGVAHGNDSSSEAVATSKAVASIAEFGVSLTDAEVKAFSAWLDRDAEGIIRPSELLAALRHIDNPLRRSLVNRACEMLPKDADGMVATSVLLARLDAGLHPQVVCGEISENDVSEHFDRCFGAASNPTGTISVPELQQYFAGLTAVVDADARFAAIVRGCWHLPHFDDIATRALASAADANPALATNMSVADRESVLLAATMEKALADTVAHHRKTLIQSAPGMRALGCALRSRDPAGTGFLSQDDFLDALKAVRLYVSHLPVLSLLDANQDGSVDYRHYQCALVGELAPPRRVMAERLWRSFPANKRDEVEVSWLHKRFAAQSGEELNHFLEAWDLRTASGAPERAVCTSFEFVNEWLVPMSERVQKDSLFEKFLGERWSLDN